ncbi:MAG: hypothetical protein FJX74_13365 [Armatimonadetes bacterium]|nr:hypothetical protein [Armatimonadota bacterium]
MPRVGLVPALMALTVTALAQGPLIEWSFEAGVGEWASLDPAASVSVTTDGNAAREDGDACLEFAYTPEAALTVAVTPVAAATAGAQSLRFHLRTSEYAWASAALAEQDGSAYLATFSSLPGAWQEVALGLNEFRLLADTGDENRKLDPEQIAAVGFGDAIYLLDAIAKLWPFILAPDLGPRLLWVDEVRLDPEPVPPRWEVVQVAGGRAVRLESFEGAPLQWLTLSGKGIEVTYDREHRADGEFSLRLAYNLPPDKVFGVLTDPADAPLANAKQLRMSMISEKPITLLLEMKESDESKYQASAQVAGTGEFEEATVPLSAFSLADDSSDENGRLDMGDLKQFLIADLSAALGAPTGANTLWLDNLLFTE